MNEAIEHAPHAVVLSGGGAHGAYEVGVLQSLLARPGLDPDVYAGTSVGAFNAAVLVSELNGGASPTDAAHRLERWWTETIAGNSYRNGVYRVRADPRPLIDPRCLAEDAAGTLRDAAGDAMFLGRDYVERWTRFLTGDGSWEERAGEFTDLSSYVSTAPFRKLVRDAVDPQAIAAGPRRLRIAATSLVDGAMRIFANAELGGDRGYDAVIASGSIPIVFPPHEIDGRLYVDGAVRMNTPLSPAIDAARSAGDGDPVIHLVVLDPALDDRPFPTPHSTLATFDRLYGSLMNLAVRQDIQLAVRINDALRVRRLVEPVSARLRDDPASGGSHTDTLRALVDHVEHRDRHDLTHERRPLTIHRYRPEAPLSGTLGLLDFSDENVRRMISHGYTDATAHDCDKNDCVLP